VIAEAARLSELHTLSGGHRSFDVLHVATARLLKATTFLSFDANQRKLATTGRLAVGP
jgi:predicted nucleic acid-binding protein